MPSIEEFHLEELDLKTYNYVQIDVMHKLGEHLGIDPDECAPRYSDAYRSYVRGNPDVIRAIHENREAAVDDIVRHILENETHDQQAA